MYVCMYVYVCVYVCMYAYFMCVCIMYVRVCVSSVTGFIDFRVFVSKTQKQLLFIFT